MEDVGYIHTPKRSTSLRHKRTVSDIQTRSEQGAADSNTNGLKAVSTVTGAIHSFFKWSASPLLTE